MEDRVNQKPVFVFVHSPLVGVLTWSLVAEQMRQRGLDALLPVLNDLPDSTEPFWKQHADSVSQFFQDIPNDIPVIWVAHSGAGPILPVIRQSISNPVHAYVFVDAGFPRDGATRLDLMQLEDADWAKEFKTHLEAGGRFPNWSSDDLSEILPDKSTRDQLVTELRPRGLDFFSEPIPVFDGWPDAPGNYIQFSEAYEWDAVRAREWGWTTYKVDGGHFHMLVDPKSVAELILTVV